jgi:hypothetical protein
MISPSRCAVNDPKFPLDRRLKRFLHDFEGKPHPGSSPVLAADDLGRLKVLLEPAPDEVAR